MACSTSDVAAFYVGQGFRIVPVEDDPVLQYAPVRPWEVLLRLAAGDESWRDLALSPDCSTSLTLAMSVAAWSVCRTATPPAGQYILIGLMFIGPSGR